MQKKEYSVEVGGKTLTAEFNDWADQASGSVLVRYGNTAELGALLVVARAAAQPAPEVGALVSAVVRSRASCDEAIRGIARADLLVVNKTDLAPHVGVDVELMAADARAARDGGPVLALSRHEPLWVAIVRHSGRPYPCW